MPFDRRPITKWEGVTEDKFRDFYLDPQFQILLKYIERRIKSDFIRMLASTGHVGDAFFTCRIKEPFSAFGKLPGAIKEWRRRHKNALAETGAVAIYDLIRDLVGVRLICSDTTTMADILRRIVHSDTLEISSECEFYKAVEKDTKSHGQIESLLRGTFRKGFRRDSKASGYESVHLELQFFGALDRYARSTITLGEVFSTRVEIINQLRSKMNDETATHIGRFPIECQVRLFTQHIWAQDEHKIIYGPRKAGMQARTDQSHARIQDLFKDLNATFRHAESIRDQLRQIDTGRLLKHLRFIGKSYEITSRTAYFAKPEFKGTIDQLHEIDRELGTFKLADAKSPRRDLETKGLRIFGQIVEFCEAIDQNHDEQYLQESVRRFDEEFWGRQRLVLLLIGYLLLFTDEQTLTQILEKARKDTELNTVLGIGQMIDKGRAAASRIYEHVLKTDRIVLAGNIRQPKNIFIFRDPLVYSRLASSRYRDEDFFGAANVLTELFDCPWWKTFWNSSRHRIEVPKRFQFYLRRAEYHWYHSYRSENIGAGFEHIFQDLKQCMNDPQRDTKALSWTIIIATLLSARNVTETTLGKLASQAEAELESLDADTRGEYQGKFYFNFAMAISSFKRGQRPASVGYIKHARAILSQGIAHPPGAILIGRNMCDELETELVG